MTRRGGTQLSFFSRSAQEGQELEPVIQHRETELHRSKTLFPPKEQGLGMLVQYQIACAKAPGFDLQSCKNKKRVQKSLLGVQACIAPGL